MLRKLLVGAVLILTSCQSNQKIDSSVKVRLKQVRELDLSSVGYSSMIPFNQAEVVSTNFYFFNQFSYSLGKIKFSDSVDTVSDVVLLEQDGPLMVKEPTKFFTLGDNRYLVNQSSIQKFNPVEEQLEIIRLEELPFFSDYLRPVIFPPTNFEMGTFISGLDRKSGVLYFFAKDLESKAFNLFRLNLESSELEVLPEFYNSGLIQDHDIRYLSGSILFNNNLPFLFFDENRLILTYNYDSDIILHDLQSDKSKMIEVPTSNYPNQKALPKVIPSGLNVIAAYDYNVEWNRGVTFGQIHRLNENALFRLVRTAGEFDYEVYLEVFNNEFEKIGEENLSLLESNLSTFYFPVKGNVLVKAKNQMSEDILKFYEFEIK